MTTGKPLAVACLMLIAVSGTAFASTDGPSAGSPGADSMQIDTSPRLEASGPACGCADIAFTDVFTSERLAYVTAPEFAEALRAVARGESRYSPGEIPAGWQAAAEDWGSSRSGLAGLRLLQDSEACIPALIYLASMEYRLRLGRPGLKPVFPVFVRKATQDLAERAAAKGRLAGRFAQRRDAIAAKIQEAERMGAASCAPGALADAKAELDRARRGAGEVRSSLRDTESAFYSAERAADTILARQRFASRMGRRCYAE